MSIDERPARSPEQPEQGDCARASEGKFADAVREVTLTLALPSWPDGRASEQAAASARAEHLDAWARDASNFQGSMRRIGAACADGLPGVAVGDSPAVDEQIAEGSVLALVGRVRGDTTLDLVTEMNECFALGNFSGALIAAELLLKREPNHVAALSCRARAGACLEGLLRARLDAFGRCPELRADVADRRWLSLDARVAALLPWLNGVRDYDAVIRDSGLPTLDALRALVELVDVRVVRLV